MTSTSRGSTAGPCGRCSSARPRLAEPGPGVEVLARLDDGSIAACRQGHMLATAFHPELTTDGRLHAYFLAMTEEALAAARA